MKITGGNMKKIVTIVVLTLLMALVGFNYVRKERKNTAKNNITINVIENAMEMYEIQAASIKYNQFGLVDNNADEIALNQVLVRNGYIKAGMAINPWAGTISKKAEYVYQIGENSDGINIVRLAEEHAVLKSGIWKNDFKFINAEGKIECITDGNAANIDEIREHKLEIIDAQIVIASSEVPTGTMEDRKNPYSKKEYMNFTYQVGYNASAEKEPKLAEPNSIDEDGKWIIGKKYINKEAKLEEIK